MPTVETKQWLALKAHIGSKINTIPVYAPNDVVKREDEAFILVSDANNAPERFGISNPTSRRSGTLILSLHWPLMHPITYEQLREAQGKIAEHFPADWRFKYDDVCLRVTQEPSCLEPYVDNSWRVAIVRVPWSNV